MEAKSAVNPRIVAALAVATAAVVFFASGGYAWARGDGNVEDLLTDTGMIGPLVFVLVMWCTQPLGIPGFVYMAPAGIVWPYPQAIALAWIGNMGASYLAFAFSRWFARDWVSARIPVRMQLYADRIERGGVWPVILLRLVFGQLPPADWLLGVTKVSTRNFLIGTAIGILPGVILIVIAGGGILDLIADMSTTQRRITIASTLVGLVVIRVLRRRRARRRGTESLTS